MLNLTRINSQRSVFKVPFSGKALIGLAKKDYKFWLSHKLLSNTRLVIEPKIAGCAIALQYKNGFLKKAITRERNLIIDRLSLIENIPKKIPIRNIFEIRGQMYAKKLQPSLSRKIANDFIINDCSKGLRLSFASFQIFHTKLNQYSQLQQLYKLGFEIPPNVFTRVNTNEVELYIDLWRSGELFSTIPADGLVLKVNSRKLQKQLGENSHFPNWAYAINN